MKKENMEINNKVESDLYYFYDGNIYSDVECSKLATTSLCFSFHKRIVYSQQWCKKNNREYDFEFYQIVEGQVCSRKAYIRYIKDEVLSIRLTKLREFINSSIFDESRVFDNLTDPVIICLPELDDGTRKLNVISVNKAFEVYTGYNDFDYVATY